MRVSFLAVAVVGILSGYLVTPAFCVPTFFEIQKDTKFVQTGPSSVMASGFAFVGTAAPNDGVGPIDFDGGTLAFPASSPLAPVALSPISGNSLQFESNQTNAAIFQADFPNGTYTFHVTHSANPADTQTEAVDTTIATAPTTIPQLTAASFNALQGMDPSQALTVDFNAFADQSAALNSLIFFAIEDADGNVPVFDGLQPDVTQDVIPANTLLPGDDYEFFLFFENGAFPADGNGQILFDNRTEGPFVTASVPEPTCALAVGMGLVAMCNRRRRI